MQTYPTCACNPTLQPYAHHHSFEQCCSALFTARQPGRHKTVAGCNKRDAPLPNGQAHMTRLCRLLPADEPGVFRTGTSPCRAGSARCVSPVSQLAHLCETRGRIARSTPGQRANPHQPQRCRRAPCQTSSAAGPSQPQRREPQCPSQAGRPLPSSPAAQLKGPDKSKALTLEFANHNTGMDAKQMWGLGSGSMWLGPGQL